MYDILVTWMGTNGKHIFFFQVYVRACVCVLFKSAKSIEFNRLVVPNSETLYLAAEPSELSHIFFYSEILSNFELLSIHVFLSLISALSHRDYLLGVQQRTNETHNYYEWFDGTLDTENVIVNNWLSGEADQPNPFDFVRISPSNDYKLHDTDRTTDYYPLCECVRLHTCATL